MTYCGHHFSRVVAVTADKAGDIEEGMAIEKTIDVEAVEKDDYGETSSLDGNSSIQETKSLVGSVAVVAEPKRSRS